MIFDDLIKTITSNIDNAAKTMASHSGKSLLEMGLPRELDSLERSMRALLISGPKAQVMRKGAVDAWFPNIGNTALVGEELDQRFKLAGGIVPRVILGGLGGAAFNYLDNARAPAMPAPVFYQDSSGDLRHVNDMGIGPAYGRQIMGNSSLSQGAMDRYNSISRS